MANWDDDDCWSDGDDLPAFQPIRPSRPPAEEEPEPVAPLVPIEEAFLGSVYWIADRLWKIPPSDRVAHPGVCVCCDGKRQQAVLVKGTSVRDERVWRYDRYDVLVVDPTPENGLKNSTAFALDPRPLDLRMLRRVHLEEGPRGRVSREVLWMMQARLADLERALTEGAP